MLTDLKWGHLNENALYIGAKGVFTVFLRHIHSRILERLRDERVIGSPSKEVFYLDVGIKKLFYLLQMG